MDTKPMANEQENLLGHNWWQKHRRSLIGLGYSGLQTFYRQLLAGWHLRVDLQHFATSRNTFANSRNKVLQIDTKPMPNEQENFLGFKWWQKHRRYLTGLGYSGLETFYRKLLAGLHMRGNSLHFANLQNKVDGHKTYAK